MFLKLDTSGALYDQVYRALRGQILKGRMAAGARVPATRDLALELGVSRNVAIMAYRQLLDEGYLTARKGAGTFVARELPRQLTTVAIGRHRPTAARTSAPIHLSAYARRVREASGGVQFTWAPRRDALPYDFRYGPPSFTDFPHATWCRVMARRARRVTLRDLDYGPPEGLPALREVIADYVARARAIACAPEQVLVVNGSQQALDLAARVLVDPGDVVLMEEPHYRGARTVMTAAGAKIETIAVDEHGLHTAELARRRTSSRLAIVTPSHQFPTGAVMPLGRRLELLAWARRAGATIFEDDYDSEYRYTGRPLEALAALDDSGCVLYAATFSKVMFPSLRLGYLIAPARLIEPMRSTRALMDTGGATLAQAALVDFIREGHFERHLHRMRTRNARRRAAMLDAIHRHLGSRAEVSGVNAGLHLLLWLRDVPAACERELRMRAARAGVGVYSVAPFYLSPPRHVGLLLGYAPLPEKQIAEGIRRFASVLNSLR
ncbi:MAG TPA: PLP-dependent aminotransferase family protein [Patescibacteria group bacterium]|nr:PLP-dependent aminotransferase family protein [Patescibacteria group bacterium]